MICEKCGVEHDGSYGSGRFCSAFCARSFSSKTNNTGSKYSLCIDCGKKILIDKHESSGKCRCNECKALHNSPSSKLKCRICGGIYYKNNGGCHNEFCRNHSFKQIKSLIKNFGFDKSKLGTPDAESEFYRIKNELEYLYKIRRLSMWEIGEIYGCKFPNNISKIFKYMGIERRSRKEVSDNAIYAGRLRLDHINNSRLSKSGPFISKSCWHTTWNGKEVYLRSSYELDYAKELDDKKINYDVEYLKIKYFDSIRNQYRCAIPDFYLPDTNTIVEIKSDWTLDMQNMIDKKKSYLENGYNFKLICDHKEIEI